MKKNSFLLLLVIIFVFTAAFSVQAATVSTQFLNTLTGDEYIDKEFQTSGAYGRVGKTSGTSLEVVKDGDSNYAFRLSDGASDEQQMVIYTFTNQAGTSYSGGEAFVKAPFQRITARIKLSSVEGETQLFAMSKSFSKNSLPKCSDTAGVYLKNGGAYYYDYASGQLVSFIDDGTLLEDIWYTVDVIFDVSVSGVIKMSAEVLDEDGISLGRSPMTQVSNLTWYNTSGKGQRYTRTYIINSGYAEGEYALIDDIMLFTLENTPVTCTSQEIAEDYSTARFTFSEALIADTVTKENVLFEAVGTQLDLSDLYDVSYADGILTIELGELPYNQEFKVIITTNVGVEGDILGLSDEVVATFTTPVDPLEDSKASIAFTASDDGEITAGGNVVVSMTLNNTSSKKREYMLIATSWNLRNECVAITNIHGFIDAGDEELLVLPEIEFQDSESVIRVSLVDNWFNLIPIGDVITYELGGN